MLDELKEEGIVNKVGGRFKLSTLIQKRLVMLNAGYKALVDFPRNADKMSTVLQEILEDKIYLTPGGEVEIRGNAPLAMERKALNSPVPTATVEANEEPIEE